MLVKWQYVCYLKYFQKTTGYEIFIPNKATHSDKGKTPIAPAISKTFFKPIFCNINVFFFFFPGIFSHIGP